MSNRHLTAAWKARLPSTQKLVLAYMCDRANEDGACYLLIKTAVNDCGLCERAVQKAIGTLEECGYLVRDNRPGRSSVFRVVDPLYWRQPPNDMHPRTTCTPAPGAPPHQMHPALDAPTPALDAPTPAPGAPISISKPIPNPTGDGAGAHRVDLGQNVIAPNVAAAKAMIAAGIPRHEINHQHADLVQLAETVPLREFELAAGQAVGDGKGFAYALGIVKRRAVERSRDPPQGRSRSNVPANNADFKSQTYAGSSIEQLPDAVRAIVEQQLGDRTGAAAV